MNAQKMQGILFTIGFISIVVGCALVDLAMAFWLPGGIVCGMIVASRMIPPRQTGDQQND